MPDTHFMSMPDTHIVIRDNAGMENKERQARIEKWGRISEAFGNPEVSVLNKAVAKLTGVSQPTVSKWRRGRIRIDDKHIEEISKKKKFRYQWLMTGDGRKRIDLSKSDPVLDYALKLLADLNSQNRQRAIGWMEGILEQQKNKPLSIESSVKDFISQQLE